MLKQLSVIILVAFACSHAEEVEPEVKVEEGVLVLTTENFDHVMSTNEFVLVEFYAPWCGHCKSLAPEYAKAATLLAEEESPIKLAKVDATVEKDLGTKFDVRGYPTLKFFRDGTPSDYTGGRSTDTIVSWLKKKSGPPAVTIASKEDAEKLLEQNVAVIGFFTDLESDAAKAFTKVSGRNDEILFGVCSDEAVRKEYNMEKDGVSIFKHFDDKRADLTEDLTVETISSFVQASSTPLLTEFSQEAAQKLFSKKDMAFFFLAASKSSDDFEAIAEAVRNVAKENSGKIVAVHLNTDDNTADQVLGYLSLKEGDYPTYRLLNLEKNLKYQPEDSDMSQDKISAFVASFVSGDLKPFLKSADIPENWDAEPVKILTGKNFKEVAFDESKHVFVEFYAPWCGHCKKLVPIWDELAQKYEAVENVVIAKIDSTENELEELSVEGFPTLKFFPANSKDIVDYSGDRSLEDLLKFVAKYAELPKEEMEKEAPEVPTEEKEKEAPEVPKEAAKEDDKKKDEL